MAAVLLLAVAAAAPGPQCFGPTLEGCFDNPYCTSTQPGPCPAGSLRPTLGQHVSKNDASMTIEKCVGFCCSAGVGAGGLAGLENGTDCYCDTSFGPYTPTKATTCTAKCAGNGTEDCGGAKAMSVYTIAKCSPADIGWRGNSNAAAAAADRGPAPPALKQCAGGCTSCPIRDTCCIGKIPDPYKVPGGYGCAPPNSSSAAIGCAGGGKGPWGCCCGPGPSVVSGTLPNVLIIGDSVSAGYTPFLKSTFGGIANIQHGPDNAGGGNADGAGYGQLCTQQFVRTPQQELPPWKVITFNYGLHDGGDTNESYRAHMESIADQLLATAKLVGAKPARLIYFQTTIPGGANSVPGEPVSPGDKQVRELNAVALEIMTARNITTVDLYKTMTTCGKTCSGCKPHCDAAGYQYLVDAAIAPAIRKALAE